MKYFQRRGHRETCCRADVVAEAVTVALAVSTHAALLSSLFREIRCIAQAAIDAVAVAVCVA